MLMPLSPTLVLLRFSVKILPEKELKLLWVIWSQTSALFITIKINSLLTIKLIIVENWKTGRYNISSSRLCSISLQVCASDLYALASFDRSGGQIWRISSVSVALAADCRTMNHRIKYTMVSIILSWCLIACVAWERRTATNLIVHVHKCFGKHCNKCHEDQDQVKKSSKQANMSYLSEDRNWSLSFTHIRWDSNHWVSRSILICHIHLRCSLFGSTSLHLDARGSH